MAKPLTDKSALVVRGPADLMAWFAEASERLHCSQNAMFIAAAEELRRVVELVERMSRGDQHGLASPQDYIAMLGPMWVERLVELRIGGDELREAWDWWLADQSRLMWEVQESRRERKERRS